MTLPDWALQDYKSAQSFLSGHDEQAESILDAGEGLTLVLPTGLPACAVSFAGAFMILPLLLFMVILIIFPILGFLSRGSTSPATLGITAGCALLFWGFIRVMKLLTLNRDLFPRNYFVTLGEKGIAMHFPRSHFPLRPKISIPWTGIQSVRKTKCLFLPALLTGNPFTNGMEVLSVDGKKLFIPLRPPKPDLQSALNRLDSLIREKQKRGK